MRRAAKVDANQPAIVAALRAIGATVQPLHSVGSGCPDIVVGFRGCTFLLEIKDGAKPPSARRLTPDQEDWHGGWNGQVAVVMNEAEALAAIGAIDRANTWQSIGNIAANVQKRVEKQRARGLNESGGPSATNTPTRLTEANLDKRSDYGC